jgi:hypothetical protein
MKTFRPHPPVLKLFLIFSTIFLFSFGKLSAQDCANSKFMGQGYTSSISSVTENSNGTHTIVLIVANDGCPGPACKKLNQYSVEADPGTYSNISIQTISGNFSYANINFGPNLGGDPFQGFRVNNTNGMGNGQAASFSITYTLTGPLQDQQVLAKAGSDNLIVTFIAGEFQDVFDCQNQLIFPYYLPPAGGKASDLIGPELTALYNKYVSTGTAVSDDIFQIDGSGVYIDVLTHQGQFQAALDLLLTPAYGLTSYSTHEDENTITGLFPILNLLSLNSLNSMLKQAKPIFTGIPQVGIVTSQGDTSLRSYLARTGFEVTGQGIKVGVISDSYNTQLGDPASDDVLRRDLPGLTNPDYPVPVDVVLDFPDGTRSDEGRAMLHIVHDIAPGAELAFRTGFLGPVDFAAGIHELEQAGCDIIVDDITYISEHFFRDGIVANAVNEVTALGVSYYSAAGNFGTRSYESVFYPSTAPDGIPGEAHNFAGAVADTDIYQNITLVPGNYTVVLQWDDGTPGLLTNSDFDIYLSDVDGSTLFGFNRVNTGGAPLEVLPFTVIGDTAETNFLITRAAGSGSALLKYIVFRGNIQINDYPTPDASTIVGQPNAVGATAVGAVLYSNTPEYGVNPPTVASFSSRGGTPVNGENRYKPEITAPNGVNTNVNLGGVDLENDLFPNFFGSSASAPHAAAVAALIMEAKQKYYDTVISPELLKGLLQSTAIDMYAAGYDKESGAGFIQADAALAELANPSPYLSGISYDTTLTPGVDPIEITIYGQFLTEEAEIYFNGEPLTNATVIVGDSEASSTIPTFSERYPAIQVYNPPKPGTNGTDGGLSNPLYFTTKETIIITIDDKIKKYGEVLPEFTATYQVENINGIFTLDQAGLSQEEINRVLNIGLVTVASSLSNTGLWAIEPDETDPLAPQSNVEATDTLDISILERYNIEVLNGLLTIEKLDLVIVPEDTTFSYGDEISGFEYNYIFNDTVNGNVPVVITNADSLGILSALTVNYATALVNASALTVATALVNAGVGATALVNKSFMISNATFNQFATALVNGTFVSGPSFVTATALVNTVTFSGSSALAPATALVNGEVVVNGFTTGTATALVNAGPLINSFNGATALVNATTINANSNSEAIVILGGGDIGILSGDSTGNVDLRGINLITGNTVGQHYILPGSWVSNNFNISYGVGILNIIPATVTINIDPASLAQSYDGTSKSVTVTTVPEGLDVVITYNGQPTLPVNAGSYTVVATVNDTNYTGEATATLVISPVTATVTADLKWIYDYDPLPTFTATFSGFIGNDNQSVVTSLTFTVSPTYTGAAGTYQIIPAATAVNYIFTPVNGPLYVNPNGPGTKQIKPKLVCIDELTVPDPDGFYYIANWEYENANSTDVYIPIGTDNLLSGDAVFNGEAQPALFESGGGTFSTPFDGQKLIWTVISHKTNGQKGAVASQASSSSSRCNKSEQADAPLTSETAAELKVFPNPVNGILTIEFGEEKVIEDEIMIYDVFGNSIQARVISNSENQVEVDFSAFAAGIYFVSVNTGSSVNIARIIKK